MAKRIKEKDKNRIIIFGGPLSNFFTADSPDLGISSIYPGLVDIVVKGDGEETLDEIMKCVESGDTLEGIPGIIFYKDGRYQASAERELIDDLDSLPFPSFDGFDLDKYTPRQSFIMMGKGCMRRCCFCSEPFLSKKYRYRSAINVFKEVMHRSLKTFDFVDSMINSNLRELELFCDLVIKSGILINWGGQAGIRKDMSQELLIKMKKAGCREITYGVECFSNKVLQAMNKPYTVEDAVKILRFTKNAGINVSINIIVGFPGEGEREFNETVEFLKKFHRYITMSIKLCTICYAQPGSDLHFNPDKYGIVNEGEKGYIEWRSLDGSNTYELRKKRLQKLLLVFSELKLSYHHVSFPTPVNYFINLIPLVYGTLT